MGSLPFRLEVDSCEVSDNIDLNSAITDQNLSAYCVKFPSIPQNDRPILLFGPASALVSPV